MVLFFCVGLLVSAMISLQHRSNEAETVLRLRH